MPDLNTFGYYAMLSVGMICVTVIIIFLLNYENKQKQRDPNTKPDPMIKASFITAVFAGLLIVWNFVEKDALKRFWWILPLMWILIFSFYLFMLRKRLPLDPYEQYEIITDTLSNFFNARDFRGRENIIKFDAYRTTREAGRANVGRWLKTVNIANSSYPFLFDIDKESKEVLTIYPIPPSTVKDKLIDSIFPDKPRTIEEEFGGEEEIEETTNKIKKERR